MGATGGWVGQRYEGHSPSAGRWTAIWHVWLPCMLSGPNLVTSVSPGAQGAGRLPQSVCLCWPLQPETKAASLLHGCLQNGILIGGGRASGRELPLAHILLAYRLPACLSFLSSFRWIRNSPTLPMELSPLPTLPWAGRIKAYPSWNTPCSFWEHSYICYLSTLHVSGPRGRAGSSVSIHTAGDWPKVEADLSKIPLLHCQQSHRVSSDLVCLFPGPLFFHPWHVHASQHLPLLGPLLPRSHKT